LVVIGEVRLRQGLTRQGGKRTVSASGKASTSDAILASME
jgi:hypothetical protein